jgi:non-specific serine/threonine protein kinase
LSDVDSGSLLGWRLYAVLGLSVASATEGDLGTTIECYEEVARLSRPRGEAWFLGFMGWATGYALWLAGRGEEAAELLKEALQLLRNAGDRIGSIWCIGALARIEFDQGRAERAAVLIGAMRELSVATGADRTVVPRVSQVRQEYADRIHDALGDRAYAAALERGRLLSLEDLIGMALGERSRETAEPGAPAANQPEVVLSAREREVAELVAEGLSNRQIAERLVISTRTAEGHVQRVLVKLGFTSRAQLAAWVTARRAEGR